MIKKTAFKHGWWYHYRIHNRKCSYLLEDSLSTLKEYLEDVFDNCPHDYFLDGPRGSRLRFQLGSLNIKQKRNTEISKMAKYGLEVNDERYTSNHMKVQVFMLEHDKQTIAIEVPVWLEPEEFGSFKKHLGSKLPLTGHIDLLRLEGGKIWVWDYKPSAKNEKYAATQTYFYALMLSKRTGIPLNKFRCGWFDSYNSFSFKPERKSLSEF